MQTTLNGKVFHIELSPSAERALDRLTQPLLVEMELYFSCLIRKQVHILTQKTPDTNDTAAGDKLFLRFHPVMTGTCGTRLHGDPPPLTDFPVSNNAFSPRWLKLDFKRGEWQGDYGWSQ